MVYTRALRVCPPGIHLQPRRWWDFRAPASPLLACQTQRNMFSPLFVTLSKAEPGRRGERYVVVSIAISHFLPFVGRACDVCNRRKPAAQREGWGTPFLKFETWRLRWGLGWDRQFQEQQVTKTVVYKSLCLGINYRLALTSKIFTNAQCLCIKSLWNGEFQIWMSLIKKENTSKSKYIDTIYFNNTDKHRRQMSFKKAAQAQN